MGINDVNKPETNTEVAEVRTVDRDALHRSLTRVDNLAHLMDEQFKLPVVGWRVGLDPIIGLIPGGGDWASWAVGVYIFWEALRLDIPRSKLMRMFTNLAADLVVGYIPGPGDVFDAAFKANRKNVDLLLEHYQVGRRDTQIALPTTLPAPVGRQTLAARIGRYLLGFVATIALFAIAALPFVLLWWWLNAG